MKNIAILLSGRGSNFIAISDAIKIGEINANISLVLSNKEMAPGLQLAKDRNYNTKFLKPFEPREEYDKLIIKELINANIDLVCLAGYTRIVSKVFVDAFPNKIINIHPSLLPAFPGLHAQRQALEYGVKVTGCTVHFVDEKLDHGPIIMQSAVSVFHNDTEEILSKRILKEEHNIYCQALKLICNKNSFISIKDRKVFIY